jgi:redox-sensitive bicupin YhaK (pirin superfamily)
MDEVKQMTPLTLQPFSHGTHFHGFGLRNPAQQTFLDPFLSVDHFWMSQPTFAPHPHAGFSAVTYLFDDSETGFVNRDSLGHVLDIEPGALHWTQAAGGVMHDEAPKQNGRTAHGMQIFVNLPASAKHSAPSIAHVKPEDMPVFEIGDAKARLVFGRFGGNTSSLLPLAEATLVDVTMKQDTTIPLAIEKHQQAFILMVSGEVEIAGQTVTRQSGLSMGEDVKDRSISISAKAPARFALFMGKPLREPVVWGGPFVMTNEDDINQARRNYAAGKMGSMA